jgi:hypothetical protein
MTIKEFIFQYILGQSADGSGKSIFQVDSPEASVEDCEGSNSIQEPGDNHIGYLAQHCLFNQITALKNDFFIPDYCSFLAEVDYAEENSSTTNDKADDVTIQSWFGPVGTVSPLHYDSYYNILAQVVGELSFIVLSAVLLIFFLVQGISMFVFTIHAVLRVFCP